jgi:hypothetical protein
MVILGGLVVVAGQQLPVRAQEKKDEAKKDAEKKDAEKKDTEKKDKEKQDTTGGKTLKWTAFEPKSKPFYQELTTDTTQNMKVMGQDIVQKQNQTFYIQWTPGDKLDDKNNYVVTQKIIGVKMAIDIGGNKISYDSTADPQPQNPMADFFRVLQSLELKLTISPKLEIIKIEGGEEFIKKLGATNPAMEPLLKNILSDKALKQMAEPTWGAIPPNPVKKGSTWDKTTELDLGPIGTYKTKYTYTYEGEEKDKGDKIKIDAALTYSVPGKKDGLPFTIQSANLSSKEGTGVAYFDQKAGRFSSTNMTMKLEGTLKIEVGGMATDVELNQTQVASTKSSDSSPLPKAAAEKTPEKK